ncbi:MAG TPA: sugar kinase, partial [Sphingomonas sp.]|nr:sugar kinase [Sphingomonas sp.]
LPIAIVDQLAQRTNALLRLHGRNAPVLAPVQAAAQAEDAAAVGAALLPFGNLLLPADAGATRRAALVLA